MLSIVCSLNNNRNINIDEWLNYYFTIGIRYIFFIGVTNPSNKMIHISSKRKKITESVVFNYMKKNYKPRCIQCYVYLKIGEYLKINPTIDNENCYNYFYWCNTPRSFYIRSYDKVAKIFRVVQDKVGPETFTRTDISVEKLMPQIDVSRTCIKDLTNCELSSSLYTVEMDEGKFNIPKAHNIFKKYGFVIVKNAVKSSLMEKISKKSTDIINEYYDEIIQYYKDGTPFKVNDQNTEVSCRTGDRVMIKTSTEGPFTDPELIANEDIINLLKLNLDTNRVEIGTMAAISSLPESDYQHWHRDVPIIFPSLQKDIQLPSQGLIMVAGVEDVTFDKGPTNFIPSSNILNNQRNKIRIGNWTKEDVSCEVNGYCVPEIKRGDILMFDLRTLHRGGKNRSKDWRTIMYITYVNEWYIDRINFNTKQTEDFDSIDERSQLLLSRIDHENYIKKLEDNCIENNIPISESKYEHGQRHMLVN